MVESKYLNMPFSKVGSCLSRDSVVTSMSADLKSSLRNSTVASWCNLGVGNPLMTPNIRAFWQQSIQQLNTDDIINQMSSYGDASGSLQLRRVVAKLFNRLYQWEIEPDNVLITNGSQSLFFMLINLFSGDFSNNQRKEILVPLLPEYVGYDNLGIDKSCIVGKAPLVEQHNSRSFSYRVDFDEIDISSQRYGAVLTSRPRNPTGGILLDQEFDSLLSLTDAHSIPLIIDSAYSVPFPNLCYRPMKLPFYKQTIYSFSLSKCGLPGERVGIAIANKGLIKALSNFQCNTTISPSHFGQLLSYSVLENDQLLTLCNEELMPMYLLKKKLAESLLAEYFKSINWSLHRCDGGMFLWLKISHQGISDMRIYEASKQQGLIIIPGSVFFIGLKQPFEDVHQCIRLSLSVTDIELENGIKRLAQVIHRLLEL